MKQLLAISRNTFMQTVRQPLYGIIVFATLGGLALSPSLTGWTMDDDDKMLRDLGLSTLLIQGLFLACFAASTVLNTEIEDKTVLTSASKPISRPIFIVGKYLGVLGALLVGHYLAGIALFMVLRHGVLQMSSQSSDVTVLILGPGMLTLILIAAAAANYALEWRFLPTALALCLPAATLSAAILLVIDRDGKLQTYEVTQTMDDFPAEAVGEGKLRGVVKFRPLPGDSAIQGHRGLLVRKAWQGPIGDEDRRYLLELSGSERWRRDVDFLAKECRKQFGGVEVFKAGVLIFGAIGLLGSIAIVVSTRFGMITTFVVCIMAACAGLTADYFLLPLADAGRGWAQVAYRFVPNFQLFWMVDALSEDRIVPLGYMASAFAYAGLYVTAFLALGAAFFETREVG